MPHLVLEYSENLRSDIDIASLLTALHVALGQADTVDPQRVKSRAWPQEMFLVGTETERGSRGFLHLTVSLLEGRSPDKLTRLGESLRSVLTETLRLAGPAAVDCATTIELREMKRSFYFD